MRISGWLVIVLVALAACERAGSPTARPSATPTTSVPIAVAATPLSPPSPARSPSPSAAAGEDDEEDDDGDEPWGPEFEIDADADWYFGFAPMTVYFTARALNGTPPFTFTWNFGDGSPETSGESAWHFYPEVGRYTAFVVGKDATGEHYRVDMLIGVVTPEEYAQRKGLDLSQLRPRPSPTATP